VFSRLANSWLSGLEIRLIGQKGSGDDDLDAEEDIYGCADVKTELKSYQKMFKDFRASQLMAILSDFELKINITKEMLEELGHKAALTAHALRGKANNKHNKNKLGSTRAAILTHMKTVSGTKFKLRLRSLLMVIVGVKSAKGSHMARQV
jgi:hypothetical protein